MNRNRKSSTIQTEELIAKLAARPEGVTRSEIVKAKRGVAISLDGILRRMLDEGRLQSATIAACESRRVRVYYC